MELVWWTWSPSPRRPGYRPQPTRRQRADARNCPNAIDSTALPQTPVDQVRHALIMEVGDEDIHGLYGVLDEDADGLLCHECGSRFTHLGLHAWKRHGLTADEYRHEHGLARSRGLVANSTRNAIVENARRTFAAKKLFVEARDPAAATAARLASGTGMSPEGLAASRARPGRGRRGIVVVCEWCGAAFCPLTAAKKRRFCSRSCAGRSARSPGTPR